MAASREVMWLDQFNGGLYLTSQTSDLSKEFSPDLLNVDVNTKGGFVLRGGFLAQDENPAAQNGRFISPLYTDVDRMLVQGSDGGLYEWNEAWPVAAVGAITDDNDKRVRGSSFYSVLSGVKYSKTYLVNCRFEGNIVSRAFDGTSLEVLGQIWNNDYLNPTLGNLPHSQYVENHNGYLFIADTVESGVRYPHRVRFSHQNFPESWAEDDWFEVDPTDDGDPITGLHKFRDMLVIFKRSGVYALYGPNKESWILERITDASGTCTCGAAASNSSVLYWFSTDGRLMAFNGTDTTYLSAPLQWWSDLGYIQHGGSHRVAWMDGRLWISVETANLPAGVETGERATFIWDPNVKAFTRYDKEIRDMIQWQKIGTDSDPLFLMVDDPGVYRYDRTYSTDTDSSGVTERIKGRFRTAWLDAGETATRKRWKRPQVTSAADSDAILKVRVFHDFDQNTTKRTFEMDLSAPEDATLWGPGPDGNMVWGTSPWYYRASDYYGFDRLGSAGSARAVQFEIRSDDNLGRWWFDSMALPFRRKQVK